MGSILTDYHVHLRPDDLDATAEMYFTEANVQRYRETATERGIAELGVSEHIHRFTQALQVWKHPFWVANARDDLEEYCRFVREQTDLKLGIEADFIPGGEDRTANLLEAHDFDYVLGSVHFLGDEALDMDEYDVWSGSRTTETIWRAYFQALSQAARSGLFDILAHPDLVKVWGSDRPHPEGDLRRYYEPAIEAIAESGIAVEVSTAGLRKRAQEIYPSEPFLEMCVDAGAPMALSSDAHRPEDVGAHYDQALELLTRAGVSELSVFDRRIRRLEPIGEAPPDASGASPADASEAAADPTGEAER
jgi:histidinol-phosphatase (PHP family)